MTAAIATGIQTLASMLAAAQGGIPEPSSILINPRRATALGAAIVCGLFLLQYAHRRKAYILLWAAAWLLIAPAMLLVSRGYENELAARFATGLSQLLGVSTDAFRQTTFVNPRRLRWLLAGAAWFLVTPMVFGTATVLVPGYVVSAILLAGAASMYAAILLERRMIGAGLTAFVLLGLTISNVSTAIVIQRLLATGEFLFEISLVTAVLYTFGALGMHLFVFEDMTYELRVTNRRLEDARQELEQAAITDPLTGCHNRRFLDQVADRELQRHSRFNLPLSLLFVDIDQFKRVNDMLGHEAGDRVLRYVANFLKRNIREADYVFRYGGDEFLVLITCSGGEARRKAARLRAAFDAAPEARDLPPGIGLSVGSVEVPAGTRELTPLVREADRRMYEDKKGERR
jgi:diguanylate cyclase (GGDEF)-like protein